MWPVSMELQSLLNAALIVNNCATTHGVEVKSLQTAGDVFSKGENTFTNSVKRSGFHLRRTNRPVGRSIWTVMPLAVPRGVPLAPWGPSPGRLQTAPAWTTAHAGLSKPHTITKTPSPFQSIILVKIIAASKKEEVILQMAFLRIRFLIRKQNPHPFNHTTVCMLCQIF